MADKETNLVNAEKLLAKLPKTLRDESEVVEKPGKPYSILKVRGHSIASVRDNAVRLVHAFDGSTAATAAFAKLIEESAPEAKPEPKPKADKKPAKKSSAKKPAKKDDGLTDERKRELDAEIAAEVEAEAANSGSDD